MESGAHQLVAGAAAGPPTASPRVTALVAALTLEEKAALLAGRDSWHTTAVERLGIPSWRCSDGPNGVRGVGQGSLAVPALCLPCGSALGATWDPALVEAVGVALGEQARAKSVRVLLAPTVNLHRSPLGGRTFESFSEDPLLTGVLAASYVRGVQSRGVAATVKHFVGNEEERDRYISDSLIDPRTLRELYLVPFEYAVRDGGALAVMTGYNRLGGPWCAEHPELLGEILRRQWGFRGFVMSDWWAVTSTVDSITAGLDLEMPGPGRSYGPALAAAVRSGEVAETLLDASAARLLGVFETLGALEDPPPGPEPETDSPAHRALARRAAASSIVLLRNEHLLPLRPTQLRSLAVIGQHASAPQIMGGGSAALHTRGYASPLDVLRERLGDQVELRYAPGVRLHRRVPEVEDLPLRYEVYAGHDCTGDPLVVSDTEGGELVWHGDPLGHQPAEPFSLRARGCYRPQVSGPHEFGLIAVGAARLLVDGAVLLDGFRDPPPPGRAYFGLAGQEMRASRELTAGEPVEVVVEYANLGASGLCAVSLGIAGAEPPGLLEQAAELAAACDVAVVCVGTTDEWESEGFDREDLALPGGQDALVQAVLAANPRTVVVVNAGAPVTGDWAEQVPALLVNWFGGQEAAEALADVLLGETDPAGRLPTTFPARLADTPAFHLFPGEAGTARYGEGVFVGYRWYDTRGLAVRFPFGHGLSYTHCTFGEPLADRTRLSVAELAAGARVSLRVPVRNTGERRGAEVVQCYVAPPPTEVHRPAKELKAFAKLWLDPGEATHAHLELDARAFAYWHVPVPAAVRARNPRIGTSPQRLAAARQEPGWVVVPGVYRLCIGRSVAHIEHTVELEITAPW